MPENRLHQVRAKEFLASRIVEQAQREGVPLSQIERKMLFFSEVGWTLPDMIDVSDAFDREYDQDDYEEKITGLIERFDKRIRSENPAEYDDWCAAIRFLKRRDHYINVMISQALPRPRPRGDRMKLWLTGFAIVAVFVCFAFVAAKYNLTFGHHISGSWESFHPDDSHNVEMWLWLAAVVMSAACGSLRFLLGAKRFNILAGKLLRSLPRISKRGE
jgi:hypothetical protein